MTVKHIFKDDVELKRCGRCKQYLSLDSFTKDITAKDGLRYKCKQCEKVYQDSYYKSNKRTNYKKKYNEENKERCAQWQKAYKEANKDKIAAKYKQHYKDNREKIIEKNKQYYKENKEELNYKRRQYRKDHVDQIRQYEKLYRESYKEHINQYHKNRRKTDIKFNLGSRMSTAINLALKGSKSGRHWESLVDYNVADLKAHLKSTMSEGYTWDDFLQGKLHIDHIIPKSLFNYTDSSHPDFKRCWALDNLQLLPAEENLKKSNKYDKPFQPSLTLMENN